MNKNKLEFLAVPGSDGRAYVDPYSVLSSEPGASYNGTAFSSYHQFVIERDGDKASFTGIILILKNVCVILIVSQ